MMKFNREEGLTLIELLITIAVIAIVAAISVPVVTNVIASSNQSALTQTNADVADFVNKYNNTGAWSYDATTQTFQGFVDLNGNGTVDAPAEQIEELVVDTVKFGSTAVDETADFDPATVPAAAPTFTIN